MTTVVASRPATLLEEGAAIESNPGYAYNPSLDGLRAIAVLAVLLYHANLTWAQGGFLGVDVFFVLSGYLITTLLLVEHDRSHRIDLLAFWKRRGRRLLPALFLVVGAVSVFLLVAGSYDQLQKMRGDGLSTIAYVSNWWYALRGQSYFDQFSAPSMFHHTWSLAIEEQFYLVWPIVVLLALRYGKRIGLRTWALVCVGLSLVSAALMGVLYDPKADPSRIYYGTDTRAMALLLGAALALFLRSRQLEGARPLGRREALPVVGIAGLVLLFVAFRGADATAPWMYRGGFLAVAVLSVVVIAVVVDLRPNVFGRALAWRPLVWIGLLSYGLYLWHWPIFVLFDETRTGLSGYPLLGARLLLTFGVAWLSAEVLELPVRRGLLRTPRNLWLATAGAAVVVVLFVVVTIRVPAQVDAIVTAGPITGLEGKRVLVVGDSVAFSLANVSSDTLNQAEISTGAILGCGIVRGTRIPIDRPLNVPESDACDTWDQHWAELIDKESPDVSLVLIGTWERYDRKVDGKVLDVGTPEWHDYLLAQLEIGRQVLTAKGAPMLLLTSPCSQPTTAPDGPPAPELSDPRRHDAVNAALVEFARLHPTDVGVIDLDAYVCTGGRYRDEVSGAQLHTDGVHFTVPGALALWQWLVPQIQKATPASR